MFTPHLKEKFRFPLKLRFCDTLPHSGNTLGPTHFILFITLRQKLGKQMTENTPTAWLWLESAACPPSDLSEWSTRWVWSFRFRVPSEEASAPPPPFAKISKNKNWETCFLQRAILMKDFGFWMTVWLLCEWFRSQYCVSFIVFTHWERFANVLKQWAKTAKENCN